jgi:branched-chain amino acid transport system permease protein
MASTMLGVFLLTAWIRRSRFGYGLRAIGGAEDAAKACGVNVFRLKLCAYVASAFFLAVVGGIAAAWLSYISPEDAFDVNTTIQIIVITLLGGIGHTWGPLIGAAFLTVVSEVLWARFIHTYLIILGVVIVGVVIFMPGGIAGLVRSRRRAPVHS